MSRRQVDVVTDLCAEALAQLLPTQLWSVQIQAELGEGHMNVINAKEVLLTQTHLALVMEFAAGASLTSYVAEKWQAAQHTGLFLTEDEARYFFKVRASFTLCTHPTTLCIQHALPTLLKYSNFTWTAEPAHDLADVMLAHANTNF